VAVPVPWQCLFLVRHASDVCIHDLHTVTWPTWGPAQGAVRRVTCYLLSTVVSTVMEYLIRLFYDLRRGALYEEWMMDRHAVFPCIVMAQYETIDGLHKSICRYVGPSSQPSGALWCVLMLFIGLQLTECWTKCNAINELKAQSMKWTTNECRVIGYSRVNNLSSTHSEQ